MHVSHTSVQTFSDEDMRNLDVKKRLILFDDKIVAKLAKNETLVDVEDTPKGWNIGDNLDLENKYLPYNPDFEIPETNDYTNEDLDKYLTSQVLLPYGVVTVKHRKRDANGNPLGVSDSNPILDTKKYEMYFDDVTVKEYSSNSLLREYMHG